ncbi:MULTISPECIES: GNAT family N-acetyltransferase [unclassified Fictibacillus]|uniref:GNAT family N-acetyltransferase n=1 Tax=unclassified Fictibacillus TaxID=2644029 RepID=UPI00078107C6|nr:MULTISPECIES: GNAT family N-acetyltransferase [unclassified Fictibacillus]MED2973875.1 GNAT family N-acetyltransferase [Fictibacillus sp. B-59209]SFE37650.1 Acetyltransferase (GNAT) family protein [Bacillus sp. OV194]
MSAEVSLSFYQPEHNQELSTFELPKEQLRFTALPLTALKVCEEDQSRHPVVILYEGKPAGFFVLHHGPGITPFTENPNALFIRALSVHPEYQGKRVAKRAMLALPGFASVHFPFCDELVLAVNKKNIAAQQLYFKTGFEDRGQRRAGNIGIQYILQLPL